MASCSGHANATLTAKAASNQRVMDLLKRSIGKAKGGLKRRGAFCMSRRPFATKPPRAVESGALTHFDN
jgi:hypothetical protein